MLRPAAYAMLATGLTVAALTYPGTPDVQDFLQWAAVLTAHGPATGYRVVADYPPLGPVLIWVAIVAGRTAAIPDLISLKLAIAFFQFFAAALAAQKFRSVSAGAGLWLLIAPYGTLLGYIDCFYLPFVLAAVIALEHEKFGAAGAALAIAIFIKWQPAILAPFMVIHALSATKTWRKPACLLPGAAIGLAVILFFGPASVWWAFSGAAGDPYFSGQAFNLDWIVSAGLEYFRLAGAPPLNAGAIVAITSLAAPWYLLSKIIFWTTYLAILAAFATAEKTMARLYLALAAAEAVQFTLNTGVHENHAFLLLIFVFLAVQAGALAKFYLPVVAVLAISNILIFYGLPLPPGAATAAGTVLLSFVAVAICIGLVSVFVRACLRQDSGAASLVGSA